MGPEIILKYFPALTSGQKQKIDELSDLYGYWNERINVISRKDIDQLYEHHVLYSLSIAKFIRFAQGTQVLDAGTGGGFPGIPLAIFFPETQFYLADSISKKIKVVKEISNSLKLYNVITQAERIENLNLKVDFVVGRAVTRFNQIVSWVNKNLSRESKNSIPNGTIYLKGEDIQEDMEEFGPMLEVVSLQRYFEEDYFKTKRLLYLKV
jgi:16S rRNA (guanine527-N7)-methyltransferase